MPHSLYRIKENGGTEKVRNSARVYVYNIFILRYNLALTSDSVRRFLRRLPRQQIKEVGCCLGLQDSGVSTVDELITSWLREGQDTASWEHLHGQGSRLHWAQGNCLQHQER